MYTKNEMFAYAEGYHDGRMDYEQDNYHDAEGNTQLGDLYVLGYVNGVEDRTEQDERN